MKYYRMTQITPNNSHWFLGHPVIDGFNVDPRMFTKGQPSSVSKEVLVTVNRDGLMLDISFADNEMIVFNTKAINAVKGLFEDGQVEVIKAEIKGKAANYYIVNVLTLCDCIDKERSAFAVWGLDDGLPNKIGQYRTIYELYVDKNKLQGRHILRISNWQIALIVSEAFKERVLYHNLTGVQFTEV